MRFDIRFVPKENVSVEDGLKEFYSSNYDVRDADFIVAEKEGKVIGAIMLITSDKKVKASRVNSKKGSARDLAEKLSVLTQQKQNRPLDGTGMSALHLSAESLQLKSKSILTLSCPKGAQEHTQRSMDKLCL